MLTLPWNVHTSNVFSSLFHSTCRSRTAHTVQSRVSTTAPCATTPPRPASTWCNTPAQLATSRTKDWGNFSCTSKAWEAMRMDWASMSCSRSKIAPPAKVRASCCVCLSNSVWPKFISSFLGYLYSCYIVTCCVVDVVGFFFFSLHIFMFADSMSLLFKLFAKRFCWL